MTTYRITCGDGQTVDLSMSPYDHETNVALRSLKRYYGLEPEAVLNAICACYSSAKVTFDLDPDQLHDQIIAFWGGYEMSQNNKAAC